MAFNYSPKIVTDGLVMYLDAANTKSYVSGSTTWNDISRSGINGTLTNGPTFNTGNGGSIVFDGVNDFVDCGNNSITKPSGNMTLSYWFRGVGVNVGDATGIGTLGTDRGFVLGPDNGNVVYFMIPASSTTLIISSFSTTINSQIWYNIVGTYLPSTYIKLFLNGVEVASNTNSIPSSLYTGNALSLKIGNRGDNTRFFSGNISQVSIYNRALSATEVLQNYNATKTRFGL